MSWKASKQMATNQNYSLFVIALCKTPGDKEFPWDFMGVLSHGIYSQ